MSTSAILRLRDLNQTVNDLKMSWSLISDDARHQVLEEIQNEIVSIIEEDITY